MTKCWILTEQGLKGTENQCVALAQAAGFEYELKTVKLKQPWKFFTPFIQAFSSKALTPDSAALVAPWPDILIASGRKAIAPALWVKAQSGGKTKLVIIQSPVIKNKNFDLVIVPQHDEYDGNNVLKITGALSLVTSETLAAAKVEFAIQMEQLAAPRIAVLIGGNSNTHKITLQIARVLVMQLKKLLQQNFSLMITVSRRTPKEVLDYLHQELKNPQIAFYEGAGLNPYQAYLAWSDAIIVTEDSVSMASEAISTGKPVYIFRLSGGSKRFKRFHDNLIGKGYAKWFTGQVNDWSYEAPDDLSLAIAKIGHLLHS